MYDTTQNICGKIDNLLTVYQDLVYRIALNQTRTKPSAEHVFQEVFVQYITFTQSTMDNHAFASSKEEKNWMIRTTIQCSEKYAGKGIDDSKLFAGPVSNSTWEDFSLYRTVLKLPQKQRLIIHLYYYEDMSTDEIASLLSMKEPTVKEHLAKAIHILKKSWKGNLDYV